jgi:hypothetical protein
MCDHSAFKCTTNDIKNACLLEGLDFNTDGAKVAACLRSYFAGAKPYKVIAMEQEYITEDWVFYVDAIMQDETWWYIVDIKTTGNKLEDFIRTKLTMDPQMVLYASHAHLIAEKNGLDIDKFYGIIYREVRKPLQRPKPGESWQDFTMRCGNPEYRETDISKTQLQTELVLRNMHEALRKVREIKTQEECVQNMRACVDKGSVCTFYSQCYGKTYTEAKREGAKPEDLI